jgi:hypothetical protein
MSRMKIYLRHNISNDQHTQGQAPTTVQTTIWTTDTTTETTIQLPTNSTRNKPTPQSVPVSVHRGGCSTSRVNTRKKGKQKNQATIRTTSKDNMFKALFDTSIPKSHNQYKQGYLQPGQSRQYNRNSKISKTREVALRGGTNNPKLTSNPKTGSSNPNRQL